MAHPQAFVLRFFFANHPVRWASLGFVVLVAADISRSDCLHPRRKLTRAPRFGQRAGKKKEKIQSTRLTPQSRLNCQNGRFIVVIVWKMDEALLPGREDVATSCEGSNVEVKSVNTGLGFAARSFLQVAVLYLRAETACLSRCTVLLLPFTIVLFSRLLVGRVVAPYFLWAVTAEHRAPDRALVLSGAANQLAIVTGHPDTGFEQIASKKGQGPADKSPSGLEFRQL